MGDREALIAAMESPVTLDEVKLELSTHLYPAGYSAAEIEALFLLFEAKALQARGWSPSRGGTVVNMQPGSIEVTPGGLPPGAGGGAVSVTVIPGPASAGAERDAIQIARALERRERS